METRTERENERLAEAAQVTAENIAGKTAEMGESARQFTNRVNNAWQNTKERIQEQSVASARATDEAIRHHPYSSVGVAFGIGLLIGVLVARSGD